MPKRFHYIAVYGGIDATLSVPYDTDTARDTAAREEYDTQDPETDAVFVLDIDTDGTPTLHPLSA